MLGRRLPDRVSRVLFGDRRRYGRQTVYTDADWQAWLGCYDAFYHDTQKSGLGKRVNDAGYLRLRSVDLSGRRVLEVGPGDLPHAGFWRGTPASYVVADIKETFLARSQAVLAERGVPSTTLLVSGPELALPDASIDVIIAFYCLEHMYPVGRYLDEWMRVLRPGGVIVGGIPTEGGIAWGLGRALTSRRYLRRRFGIDLDKIICWEHPNFADEVLRSLDRRFRHRERVFWPTIVPTLDANLIVSFVYQRP
jgi:SAM-dependent methyltransferase